MSIFYFSCNMRYEIWAHKKIRFTQICIFFVDMKKNSYLRLFKQTVSACFISRQFIQGWLVTVRNACIWIKLYRIFWKYKWKVSWIFTPSTYILRTRICRSIAIIRERILTILFLERIAKKQCTKIFTYNFKNRYSIRINVPIIYYNV